MAYIITGTVTFSSQANRNAAQTRVQAVISSYPQLTATATSGFSAGLATPTTTTMTISYTDGTDGATAGAIAKEIYDAFIGTGGTARHTQGFLSVNLI